MQQIWLFFFDEILSRDETKKHNLSVAAETYEEAVGEAREKYAREIEKTKGLPGDLLLLV
ncbi:hypothetical protein A2996_00160 [Candidatus Campbellbacteria bacterium RIFCSPLOWO2_01_FULL_34_15]|uniref:Uncharacterized protein n=2 Tax=Candidatus Campbelliibacteriota TaxID=1752727 RepID=A0A1F5ENY3_9BACT|nr:MAG: hypothetical protein A2996_00160 [Candidatus Campbellbacteria bacterium RIFCSPLOWO2_01_FULL_34_15]OGD69103.1 MAG: hypothetical protein A2811_02270 [Candidatus Campbellbacteria bacterium RIFCSPHIGHO2_01_FULL_34_10]OGD69104.1 MAG: hypothetical protein A2811_02275 [Candidatus Campbellbacteria bacterium RIFCSPHIGHO2_01_FULL_34_10]